MKKIIVLLFMAFSVTLHGQEKMKSDSFTFVFEGRRLSGVIDLPVEKEPTAMVIIVPGSGRTNMVSGTDILLCVPALYNKGLPAARGTRQDAVRVRASLMSMNRFKTVQRK